MSFSKIARVAFLAMLAGCATYQADLARGQSAFEDNNYERCLGLLRSFEHDTDRLSPAERVRYAYLRGMADYRMGYRVDARHWLGLAAAQEKETPNSLPVDWSKRMNESLAEMNEQVYQGGFDALSNKPKEATDQKSVTNEEATDAGKSPKKAIED